MASPRAASEVLDREFLEIRKRLIDVAASLDRIDRAEGSVADDPRMEQIRRSLPLLGGATPNRAEQIQSLFSLPYQPDWRKQYGV